MKKESYGSQAFAKQMGRVESADYIRMSELEKVIWRMNCVQTTGGLFVLSFSQQELHQL